MPNKRRLFIVGASHFGREMESWLDLIPEPARDWRVKGFLHTAANPSPLEGFPSDYRIIGSWESFAFTKDDYAVVAVADPTWKERIFNHLNGKLTFFNYVAPNATVGKFSQFGPGTIICPNCIISTNVITGRCVIVNTRSGLGHDVAVGDFSSIMGNVSLNGGVKVGRKVFIGGKSLVLPQTVVEDNSVIGVGSVVIKTVKSGTTVFGNPAKVITAK